MIGKIKFKVPTLEIKTFRSLYRARQIPDSYYEKKKYTQNKHLVAHFEYFFTCHHSKTV